MHSMLTIDIVSDIACPWCAVGLASLQQALARCADAVQVRLRVQPFELNPAMPPEGEDLGEHLTRKYGSTPAQQAQMRAVIAERGLAARTPNLLASTVFGALAPRDLVAWVLEDRLPVRVQLQMHKFIWPPDAQGV